MTIKKLSDVAKHYVAVGNQSILKIYKGTKIIYPDDGSSS